MALKRVLELK